MDKNFSSSPYGEGSPKRNDQQNTLSAILRGALGQEETGSVLDPRTAGLKEANSKANLAAILSDLIPGKGAATGGAMLAGALRRSGRPDLFLSHGAYAHNLLKNGELIRELTHPSMAITKDAPKAPWGDTILIPREGKFDPRTTEATLHDFDAWTHGYDKNAYTNPAVRGMHNTILEERLRNNILNPQFENPGVPGFPGFIENDAQARLSDKFAHFFEKGGLNETGPGGSALGVNRFPSFEAYENAKIGGARRLEGGTPVDQKYFSYLQRLADDPTTPATNKEEALQMLLANHPSIAHRAKGQKAGQVLMKLLRQSPQDYGELKVFGHVPLTADNFAGAMLKQNTPQELADALKDRGILHEFLNSDDPAEAAELANWMQNASRQAMTPRTALPKTPIQFNDNLPPKWDTWSLAEKARWANKNPPKAK